jgi:hypothetical protein
MPGRLVGVFFFYTKQGRGQTSRRDPVDHVIRVDLCRRLVVNTRSGVQRVIDQSHSSIEGRCC